MTEAQHQAEQDRLDVPKGSLFDVEPAPPEDRHAPSPEAQAAAGVLNKQRSQIADLGIGGKRTGTGRIERKALYAMQQEIGALPASLIVQLLLWPDTLSEFARQEGVSPGLVFNTLAGHKTYRPMREKLARRLGVELREINYLIDAERQLPSHQRRPEPPDELEIPKP